MTSLFDNNSVLMEVFKDKAPGTFRHCQNVSDLCESIINELHVDNPDDLLLAAKVHDIGKSNNPEFFSENQASDRNPHNDIEPEISYQYISRHVGDSVLKLIQIPEIPRNTLLMVSEHHGDSVVGAIFGKAKEKYNGDTVIDHYRYKNRKPSCIESAILMICDVIESACRSMNNNGKLIDHKQEINKLIDCMMDDEQLDILTIGNLRIIKKILYKEIEAVYHKRVDYDEESKKVKILDAKEK